MAYRFKEWEGHVPEVRSVLPDCDSCHHEGGDAEDEVHCCVWAECWACRVLESGLWR